MYIITSLLVNGWVNKRIIYFMLQETERLMSDPVQGLKAVPDESNARYFHVTVTGPKDVCL